MVPTSIATPEDADQGVSSGKEGTIIEIETKFGPIQFDPSKAVTIPQGILGFPVYTQYGLVAFPDERYGKFMILQCLENPDLCFPVLSLDDLPGKLQQEHIDEAFDTLSMPRENAVILVIVTVRMLNEKVSMTANLRAPVFIETSEQVGRQLVLPHSDYEVRHQL